MSNAFAPRSYEAFEDEFDLDAEFAPQAGGPDVREPLQSTAPAAGAPAASQAAASPAGPAPVSGQMPVAASSFNPVGDMVAGAASALTPASMGAPHAAEVSVPRI